VSASDWVVGEKIEYGPRIFSDYQHNFRPIGTIGTVVKVSRDTVYVNWPKEPTPVPHLQGGSLKRMRKVDNEADYVSDF
jgi:hypothetical protein